MLLAEDLLLLITDDDTGKLVVSGTEADIALGGAQLVQLALAGRVDLTHEGEGRRKGRLVVRDATPTGDPLLDEALAVLVERQGKRPADAVGKLGKRLRQRLYDRLVQQGILRAEEGRVLGVFPKHTWPAADAAHEREVRELVDQVLVSGVTPQPRTAALVALLHALRVVPQVVDPERHGLPRRQLERRAQEVAEGDWGSAAVRSAIEAMRAAVFAAVTAGTVGGATSN
ncbi:GOLPH3/VPS74 family protein [Nocardioides mesophilus]|uniref:GPP34 family phosphoprotein n=1 Tax=Nocardioides mesophilus TaxID=433659 RepID=A0A7G9RF80_9ACTN|nr:GPP34 family phosphoprotein [Nocardioides mesophilus]QNN54255.1 GPP34 family phosphoprotein [Nocardioides mesophilus]